MAIRAPKTLLTAAFWAATIPIFAYQAPESVAQLKKLPPGENVIWQDPGDVASLDFVYGVGGEAGSPRPPFAFISEDLAGTNPKVKVKDAQGRVWSVKFGEEAKPSVFATRLAWACGYTVEVEYFVSRGVIGGTHDLKRARANIQGDGSFTDARFQLRSDSPKYLENFNWAWSSNPFQGTAELNGLRVVTMLLSNWDTKDARDRDYGAHALGADSNLAIFEDRGSQGPRYLFFISDWGASLGKWGSTPGLRNKFNCRDYAAQTRGFVQGVDNGVVRWGFSGKHTEDIVQGIRVSDVQWLLKYLGQVTDNQLRRGLAGSGASPEQIECFSTSIRQRIDQLKTIANR